MIYPQNFNEKLSILEQHPPKTFLDLNPEACDREELRFIFNYLYHGIRFQNHLEKLESIFRDKAILASNSQNNYSPYNDNCNEGEYVSLLSTDGYYDLEYETFILPNITLIISPECRAIKTNYLPFYEWEQLKGQNTKNRYSYAKHEYQFKQMIPISMVRAIGIPARYLKTINKEELIDIYIHDILDLMTKYNITLPIVDTSAYNAPLYTPDYHNNTSKKKLKSKQ